MTEHGEPYWVTVVAGILIEDGARHGYRVPMPNAYAELLVRMATTRLFLDGLRPRGETPAVTSADYRIPHGRGSPPTVFAHGENRAAEGTMARRFGRVANRPEKYGGLCMAVK